MRAANLTSLICLSAAFAWAGDDNIQLGLRLPPGFEVSEFADSKLANDIFSMTIDPRGRVVVSGRGYIRILVDDDSDGRADRAIDFADGPADGAQGLLWEGTSLFVTGDGGLRLYRDDDGDDRADGPSELIRKIKTGGEHEAHDIKRGPDGWLYVLCGNFAGIDKSFAELPTSPIRDPVAGCVIRLSPDLKSSEIVADGFRNAYRMDWNPDGELYTYDSDNERCVSLPWYEPTRFYHVVSGGNYGWLAPQRAQFWRVPSYAIDAVGFEHVLFRGSPTGVVCYRHVQFPSDYRGGMFLADWTFGKIYFAPCAGRGNTFSGFPDSFIESVGENGFAPTDMVVHPGTGDLFISIGGRGTRGAVYRVRYLNRTPSSNSAMLANFAMKPRSLDWASGDDARLVRQAQGQTEHERTQALVQIRRHREQFTAEQIQQVVRANWDRFGRPPRHASAALIATLNKNERQALEKYANSPIQDVTYCLGIMDTDPNTVLERATALLRQQPRVACPAARLIQLALGDVGSPEAQGTIWEGYSRRELPTRAADPQRSGARTLRVDDERVSQAARALRESFPTNDVYADAEIARTLGMLEDADPATARKILSQITDRSEPALDIHYLAVAARLRSPRDESMSATVASALLDLDRKITAAGQNRDRNWPLRVAELHAELARKDSKLNDRIVVEPAFGRPDHALFARCPGFDRRRAAKLFLAKAASDRSFAWSADLVELVGDLPNDDSIARLRSLWDNLGLQESILRVLARLPESADREKFFEGLNSPQFATVRECLAAIEKLPRDDGGVELLVLIRALRRLQGGREEDQIREHVGKLLQARTGQPIAAGDARAWTDWFAREHPEQAARLGGADGVDRAAWDRRLAALDWSAGDAARGREIFARTGCNACHSGARAIGPDLRGAASRFSRDDLFTAILQPSRDVSPRYQTTLVATADGKLYQGTIIYEAVDSLILQTGADSTIRITNNHVAERRVTPNSLMPSGLLDKLGDQEIVDLYAYLKNLR